MEQRPPSGQTETGNGHPRDLRKELQGMEREMAERLGNLRSRFNQINETAVTFIRKNPGASLAMAMAAGFLVGRLMRA